MPATGVRFGVCGDGGGGRRDHHRRRVGVKRRTRILAPDVWVSVGCSTPTGEERTRAEQQQLGKCAATATTQDKRHGKTQEPMASQRVADYTDRSWPVPRFCDGA